MKRVQSWLMQFGGEEEEAASKGPAVALGALLGAKTPREAYDHGLAHFCAAPFSALSEAVFVSRDVAAGLGVLTQVVELGECDAFISHSWSDSAPQKWSALTDWATVFTKQHGMPTHKWGGWGGVGRGRGRVGW